MDDNQAKPISPLVYQFWVQFKDKIFERLSVVEEAASALSRGQVDDSLRRNAESEAHKLAGSLGMFGLREASQMAREAELLLAAADIALPADVLRMQELAGGLRAEVVRGPATDDPKAVLHERPYLLVVDSDVALTRLLAHHAGRFGLQAGTAHDVTAARQAISQRLPNIVLLELGGNDQLDASLGFLQELSQHEPPLPVIVFTERDALIDRVEAARRGVRGFLHKPLTTHEVLQAVSETLEPAHASLYQVLALDDDAHFLLVLEALLASERVRLTTATSPAEFWETLEVISPDLVILDVEMPGINGLELCRVLRGDSRWNQIPVMFLTGLTDTRTAQHVYSAGADDVVQKSMVESELATRMLNRLKRSELQRKIAETDPLTGIANRKKFNEMAQKLLRLAERQQRPFSFAILDLDLFKQVNDRYGHAVGDDVLRRMGEIMIGGFRAEDVVGRWGGEEFCVAMYGMSRTDGVNRLTMLLNRFRNAPIRAGNAEFSAAFSCGVAQFPEDGLSLEELYRSADSALYQAKASGRGRVLPACPKK